MNTQSFRSRTRPAGYALLLALIFVAVSLLLLTSLLQRTSGNTWITDRNNAYNRSVAAAEAATENVLSHITRDFVNQTFNPANLSAYRALSPTNDWAAEFEFSDGTGTSGRVWVDCSPTMVLTNLDSRYIGLYGQAFICRTRANARLLSAAFLDLNVAVRQDFQLAFVPIFQFGTYYAVDMEYNTFSARIVTGKVHGNANVYISPDSTLEFTDAVGAVGKIFHNRHPDDPKPSSGILPVYDGSHLEKISSLTLPVGSTNNNPTNVRQILYPPPAGENPSSVLGRQRYYNKADLIVTTTTGNVSIQFNNFGNGSSFTTISNIHFMTDAAYTFLTTNAAFYDYREGKSVLATEFDVGKFSAWMTTNPYAISLNLSRGRVLNSIYVDDNRDAAGRLTAVRVVNGQTLPPSGLTIASARPLYVKGNFNVADLTVGSTNTSMTKPASLVGDSLTILSANWSDDWNASTPLFDRSAANTTINAAILAGIVPTTNTAGIKHYSGGVDNFPRLLENWHGVALTYNGSMVVLFPSRYATSYWVEDTYYLAPARKWNFDRNFLSWDKLPPGTPLLQKLVRGRWTVLAADSVN